MAAEGAPTYRPECRQGDSLLSSKAATVTSDVRGEPMPKIAEETCLPVDIHMQPLVQDAAALRPVIHR
jgi:hypothetical protein